MHLRIYIWFCWISRWRNFKRFQIIDPIYYFQLDDRNQNCNLKIEMKREREINKNGSKIKSIDTFFNSIYFCIRRKYIIPNKQTHKKATIQFKCHSDNRFVYIVLLAEIFSMQKINSLLKIPGQENFHKNTVAICREWALMRKWIES